MKILYYIDNMHFGGAARKLSLIASELTKRSVQVCIATNAHNGFGFPISNEVMIEDLYTEDAYRRGRIYRLCCMMQRARWIAKKIRPDVIVTVIPHITFDVKIATLGLGIPTIFSDETSFARKDNKIDYFVRHWFYHFGDAITLLTNNDANILGRKYHQKVVIHNPLVYKKYSGGKKRSKTILAVGPLNEWYIKGFDILIQAFIRLSKDFPEWNLKIAGKLDTAGYNYISNIVEVNNLVNKVVFLDFCPNIDSIMQEASIYALSSRVEGFSLSLVESISQGCSCVAFDNHGVITEVTDGGLGTIIVPDGDLNAYIDALRILMSNDELRLKIVADATPLIQKYSIDNIINQWINLFTQLCKTK